MSEWFNNKSQIVTTVCAVASVVLAAVGAINQQFVPMYFILTGVPIALLIIWRLAAGMKVPSIAPDDRVVPSSAAPDPKPTDLANWKVEHVTLQEGKRWTFSDRVSRKYEIKFGMLFVEPSNKYGPVAKLEIKASNGERFVNGEHTQVGSELDNLFTEFFLPQASGDIRKMVTAAVFSDDLLRIIAVSVDHIDVPARTVDLEITLVSGYRERL